MNEELRADLIVYLNRRGLALGAGARSTIFETANDQFVRALQLNPNYAPARYNLAVLKLVEGK
ncbi:MAG: hypothetical protein KC766_15065, partial [Myxococcales bacterium]|nr:hypothetical protein [Myxococcales bacterium]